MRRKLDARGSSRPPTFRSAAPRSLGGVLTLGSALRAERRAAPIFNFYANTMPQAAMCALFDVAPEVIPRTAPEAAA